MWLTAGFLGVDPAAGGERLGDLSVDLATTKSGGSGGSDGDDERWGQEQGRRQRWAANLARRMAGSGGGSGVAPHGSADNGGRLGFGHR